MMLLVPCTPRPDSISSKTSSAAPNVTKKNVVLRMRCTLYRQCIAKPHQAPMPRRPGSKFHDTVGESPVRCGERVGVKGVERRSEYKKIPCDISARSHASY